MPKPLILTAVPLALIALASLSACAVDPERAQRRAIAQLRSQIERLMADAAAQAEAACGGPVVLNVEGDPADRGYEPSDYACLPPDPQRR